MIEGNEEHTFSWQQWMWFLASCLALFPQPSLCQPPLEGKKVEMMTDILWMACTSIAATCPSLKKISWQGLPCFSTWIDWSHPEKQESTTQAFKQNRMDNTFIIPLRLLIISSGMLCHILYCIAIPRPDKARNGRLVLNTSSGVAHICPLWGYQTKHNVIALLTTINGLFPGWLMSMLQGIELSPLRHALTIKILLLRWLVGSIRMSNVAYINMDISTLNNVINIDQHIADLRITNTGKNGWFLSQENHNTNQNIWPDFKRIMWASNLDTDPDFEYRFKGITYC